MPQRQGFTLIEIIIVLVILSIVAAIAIPNYNLYIQQGAAQNAQNNLIVIYNAEKNYYFNYGNYVCLAFNGCNTVAAINAALGLNITDNYFNYSCCSDPTGFRCYAGQTTNPNQSVGDFVIVNSPIVLSGGSGTLNPSSALTGSCPSGHIILI